MAAEPDSLLDEIWRELGALRDVLDGVEPERPKLELVVDNTERGA